MCFARAPSASRPCCASQEAEADADAESPRRPNAAPVHDAESGGESDAEADAESDAPIDETDLGVGPAAVSHTTGVQPQPAFQPGATPNEQVRSWTARGLGFE